MVSEKLKELRKKSGLTQEQLAEKLNVSRQAVTKWESGLGLPDIENLKNISLIFHVSTDPLLDNCIEKNIILKDKFTVIKIALFALGIALGIVAESFSFGFVMALLLPGTAHYIQTITLERKFRKEKDTLSEKMILTEQLQKDFYGRILNTNSQSKKIRIKRYLAEATLMASLFTLFDIVGVIFKTGSIGEIQLFGHKNLDNIMSYAFSFVLSFIIFFVLDYLRYEHIVKKYNRIGKE